MGSYTRLSMIHVLYTCEDMHVYRKVLSVRTRKGTTYVNLHNIRSYRNVSMIENMYTLNENDVFKGVLSVNTRKGKSICEFAQHGFIYVHKYLCYDICNFVSMCLFKVWTGKGGDICEFAQHGFIHESIYNMIYIFEYIYIYKQKGSKCEHSQGCKHMGFRTAWVQIQNYTSYNTCIRILVNICICILKKRKVLSVRTRKGTSICKFAQHPFIYKRIYDRKYVHFE